MARRAPLLAAWPVLTRVSVSQSTTRRIRSDALAPNAEAAINWLVNHGDVDGDGYVEYQRKTDHGLANQGWKDSQDAIFHADGRLAEGPIALVEGQGYVYCAKLLAARCAQRLGRSDQARQLKAEADVRQQQQQRES